MRSLVAGALCALLMAGAAEARSHHSSGSYSRSYSSSSRYYTNVSGHRVHRPMFSSSQPRGATAHCADGSYSFSEHSRGTCSHHGGVR